MYEQKNNKRHRTWAALLVVSMLLGIAVGLALGIQLYNISTLKVGYWEGNVEATDIVILTINHQIRGSNRITTTIRLQNNGAETVACNCTLYYTTSEGQDLAIYSFNATIDSNETYSKAFSIQPITISEWAGTDVSIYEY